MMDWFLGELVYSKKGSVLIGSELGLGFFFGPSFCGWRVGMVLYTESRLLDCG